MAAPMALRQWRTDRLRAPAGGLSFDNPGAM